MAQTTFALIPGAGGEAWYWHRVAPLLSARGADVVAIDLPADDDTADLSSYADIVADAVADGVRPARAGRPVDGRIHRADWSPSARPQRRSCW